MSDFDSYQIRRSPEEKRRQWWDLLKILVASGLIVSLFGFIYWHRDSRVDELMDELAQARQASKIAHVPSGWTRETLQNTVHYHSPPVEADVCNRLTRTTFEPPDGIRVVEVGKWCSRGSSNRITFSEQRRRNQ